MKSKSQDNVKILYRQSWDCRSVIGNYRSVLSSSCHSSIFVAWIMF